MTPAQTHRRGLHEILRENGGGTGWQAADDQRQIVLFYLPYPCVSGGVCVPQRKLQWSASPNMSLSVNRCPFAKSPAEIRFRPSSCTSRSSSRPSPQTTTGGLKLTNCPGTVVGRTPWSAPDPPVGLLLVFQTCSGPPLNVVCAPGQGCIPRTRL